MNKKAREKKELHILVPLDGSRMSELAIDVVQTLNEGFEVHVLLLHIIEEKSPTSIHGERHLSQPIEAQNYLSSIAEGLRDNGIKAEIHVHENKVGDVARSVVQHAQEMSPDLIIIRAHGSGGIKEFLFGTIAQQTLYKGTWPVLFIPPGVSEFKRDTFSKILVPLDETHHPELTLKVVARYARAMETEATLLFVIPTVETLSGNGGISRKFLPKTMEAVLDLAEVGANEHLENAANSLNDIRVKTEILRGDPVAEVVSYAKAYQMGLVVLSTHGKSGISAFLSGSSAQRIVNNLGCPALLLRSV